MNDYFLIARIVSASGSEGFLNLRIFTDFPEKLFDLKKVYIDFFGNKKKIWVEKVLQTNKSFRIKFKDFDSFRDLQVFIGRDIFIQETDAANLPEGNFFIHDLIDSTVWQNDKCLGNIKEVLKLPANDVFVIFDEKGNELLFPFVMEFIEEFDIKNKKLILKPGAGEYEDDEN